MILRNPFYYGAFKFNGEVYQGKHKPAITKKLFDQCQSVMARKAHPTKRGKQKHILRGVFSCAECGCGITSEVQKGHVYYRCTKKKGVCAQPYVREELLASQITEYLQKISLSSAWANEMLTLLEKEQAETTHTHTDFFQTFGVLQSPSSTEPLDTKKTEGYLILLEVLESTQDSQLKRLLSFRKT